MDIEREKRGLVCTYIDVYMYAYRCIHVYTCMYVYMCVYIYI